MFDYFESTIKKTLANPLPVSRLFLETFESGSIFVHFPEKKLIDIVDLSVETVPYHKNKQILWQP